MTIQANEVTAPPGRLVQGTPWEIKPKEYNGEVKRNEDGTPRMECFLAVAIQKGPAWDAFWGQVYQLGAAAFPNGAYAETGFSWKIDDGDAPKNAGKVGFAGCWILKMASGYTPNCYTNDQPVPLQTTDQNLIHRGCYVQVALRVNGNDQLPVSQGGKAGVHLNCIAVVFNGHGEAIHGGPDVGALFAQPAALAAGASAAPLGGAVPIPASTGPGAVMQPAAQPVAAAVVAAPVQPVAAVVAAPVQPVAAAVVAAPVQPVAAVVAAPAQPVAAVVAQPVAAATAPVVAPQGFVAGAPMAAVAAAPPFVAGAPTAAVLTPAGAPVAVAQPAAAVPPVPGTPVAVAPVTPVTPAQSYVNAAGQPCDAAGNLVAIPF